MPSLRVPQVRRVPPPSLWTTAECSQPQESTHSTDKALDPKTYTHTRRNRGGGRRGREWRGEEEGTEQSGKEEDNTLMWFLKGIYHSYT